jgi:2-polyprenyl-3-methyl-5-hydroxy-6-metoxy-1,4-benzoquinol methylase
MQTSNSTYLEKNVRNKISFQIFLREEFKNITKLKKSLNKMIREISIKHLAPTYYNRYTETLKTCNVKGIILNVGCKDFNLSREFMYKGNKVVNCDIYLKRKKLLKEVNFIFGNCEKLPFKDNSFAAVVCLDVIEHIKNEKQVIKEIFRVLNYGGLLILSTVNENFPFTYDPVNYLLKRFKLHLPIGVWGFGHKRIYNVKQLEKLVEKNGFKIQKIKFLTHFLAGFFENYLSEILRPLSESRLERILTCLAKYFLPITKLVVHLDNKFFLNDAQGVEIMIIANKKMIKF